MRQLVPTGLTVEIPPGFEGQVRPRSGLALNHGVTVLNSPGTVDSDYRGEIKVLLVNLGRETFVITRGQRIAQLIINSVARAELIDVRAVAASRRGQAGFGSTGLMGSGETDRPVPPAPRAAPVPKIILPPAAPVLAARPIVAARKAVPAPEQAKPAVTAKQVNATKTPSATVNANSKTAAPPAAKKPAPKAAPNKAASAKGPADKATPSRISPSKAPAGKVAVGKRPLAKAPAKPELAKRPLAAAGKAKVPARA